jgi:hypothetical protein
MVDVYGFCSADPVHIKGPSNGGPKRSERNVVLSHRHGNTRYECGDCGKVKPPSADGWQRVEGYYPAAPYRELKSTRRGQSQVVDGVTPAQPRDRCPHCIRTLGTIPRPVKRAA